MEGCFEIAVNGASRTVEGHGDTALLYVLRNMLCMRGSRFGCGHEQCGASMVLVKPRSSSVRHKVRPRVRSAMPWPALGVRIRDLPLIRDRILAAVL